MGLFGKRPAPRTTPRDHLVTSLERHVEEAETRYLGVIRRELANLLLESDPLLFDRTYRKAQSMASDLTRADAALVEAEEHALLQRFRHYPDFELIGTWHVVPYAEGRDMISDDQIVDRYLEVTRMLLLLRRRDPYLRDKSLFEERETKAFEDNLRRHLDRRLRKQLEEAMRIYYAYRAGWEAATQDPWSAINQDFRSAELIVTPLQSMMDHQFGITFPKTNEHGVYSFFVFDDGRVHNSYDASDAAYGSRRSLIFG